MGCSNKCTSSFIELFQTVVGTFEIISTGASSGWNAESTRAAEGLLHFITKYQFIISLVVTNECLHYTKGLTVSLQKRVNDICQAYHEVKTVTSVIRDVRAQIDVKHKIWHDTAVTLGQPQLPRRCSIQTSRSNTPGDTPEEYYRRTLSIPFLDELITHLESRFSDVQQKAIQGMRLVPSVLVDPSIPMCDCSDLLENYGDDLPSPSSLEAELNLWKHKWESQASNPNMPTSPSGALYLARKSMWPNIHTILRLICTIPATRCKCERSISSLRRLKTHLCSTIGQERLSGLALMHSQYGIELNFEEIINIIIWKEASA